MIVQVRMDQIIDFRNNTNFLRNAQLPLKAAYKINKLRKAIDNEFNFYSEKFQELVDTYAQKDDNGNVVFSDDGSQIIIKDGMIEECNNAIQELHNLTIDIDNMNLSIEDLGEDLECTPDELDALMPFFS